MKSVIKASKFYLKGKPRKEFQNMNSCGCIVALAGVLGTNKVNRTCVCMCICKYFLKYENTKKKYLIHFKELVHGIVEDDKSKICRVIQ